MEEVIALFILGYFAGAIIATGIMAVTEPEINLSEGVLAVTFWPIVFVALLIRGLYLSARRLFR